MEILEDLIYFKKEKGLDWNKAVTAALDRNFDVFGKVLKARDIGKRIRGEADTDTGDSQESDDEDETESIDEEIDSPYFRDMTLLCYYTPHSVVYFII